VVARPYVLEGYSGATDPLLYATAPLSLEESKGCPSSKEWDR